MFRPINFSYRYFSQFLDEQRLAREGRRRNRVFLFHFLSQNFFLPKNYHFVLSIEFLPQIYDILWYSIGSELYILCVSILQRLGINLTLPYQSHRSNCELCMIGSCRFRNWSSSSGCPRWWDSVPRCDSRGSGRFCQHWPGISMGDERPWKTASRNDEKSGFLGSSEARPWEEVSNTKIHQQAGS